MTLEVGVAHEMVQVVGWLVGGATEVGVAHTAGHRNSTVDVAATSGSEYFSLWAVGAFWGLPAAGSEEGGEEEVLCTGHLLW